jgi:hypothetical protein
MRNASLMQSRNARDSLTHKRFNSAFLPLRRACDLAFIHKLFSALKKALVLKKLLKRKVTIGTPAKHVRRTRVGTIRTGRGAIVLPNEVRHSTTGASGTPDTAAKDLLGILEFGSLVAFAWGLDNDGLAATGGGLVHSAKGPAPEPSLGGIGASAEWQAEQVDQWLHNVLSKRVNCASQWPWWRAQQVLCPKQGEHVTRC